MLTISIHISAECHNGSHQHTGDGRLCLHAGIVLDPVDRNTASVLDVAGVARVDLLGMLIVKSIKASTWICRGISAVRLMKRRSQSFRNDLLCFYIVRNKALGWQMSKSVVTAREVNARCR